MVSISSVYDCLRLCIVGVSALKTINFEAGGGIYFWRFWGGYFSEGIVVPTPEAELLGMLLIYMFCFRVAVTRGQQRKARLRFLLPSKVTLDLFQDRARDYRRKDQAPLSIAQPMAEESFPL